MVLCYQPSRRKCSDETGIPSESFYLAAVSIGSGNDWIKSTGAPNDIEGIADLLVANSFSVQDVIKVEAGKAECYMVNCCGIGFDSHLIQRVNLQKNRGKTQKINLCSFSDTHNIMDS